uniref:Transcription cofactor HES-6-like n=1 Tax=Stegastes partitus TaxID=144197 RepID=A0A3B5A707_9TELE
RGGTNMTASSMAHNVDKHPSLRKPLIERKRRERINNCLDQLREGNSKVSLVSQQQSKLEKADILEMTVKHLPGGPAEIQHRLHPVHARGPQHAAHLRLDGQNSGLPSAQPPPQVPAQVHRRAAPHPARPPSAGRPRHAPQRRPPGREAAPQRGARLPRGWTSGEVGAPQLPPGDAGDVEALVNRWINRLGSPFC